MQNKKVVLASIVILFVAFLGGAYFYKSNQSKKIETMSKEQALLFQRPYSLVIGNEDAKVQLVEFLDPACGTCALFYPKVKELMKKHEGKIKLVVRYAPFHQNSNYAVKMLEGAREQNKFSETLELMFASQRYWTNNHVVEPQLLWRILPKAGLDMEKLNEFMNSSKADEIIKQDLADIQKLGIDKTPSFFVNGKPLQVFGWDNLVKLVESQL